MVKGKILRYQEEFVDYAREVEKKEVLAWGEKETTLYRQSLFERALAVQKYLSSDEFFIAASICSSCKFVTPDVFTETDEYIESVIPYFVRL